jgi:hypothetical protein
MLHADAGTTFELVALDGAAFDLAPGVYEVELEARIAEGALAPRLRASGLGRSNEIVLTPYSPTQWHGRMSLAHAANSLELLPAPAPARFLIARLVISDRRMPAADEPSLRAAFLLGARALFRRCPQGFRDWVLRSPARVRWLARHSMPQLAAPEDPRAPAGRIVASASTGDSAPWRADFEERLALARGVRDGAHVAPGPAPALPNPLPAKLVAFHLPQFHAIPENDAWWGEGFTEWTNVTRAVPQFVGHDQPRLPGELGFYDLTAPGMLARQAKLARAFGVSAFCFYYYWFAGKRLLERPLDMFLADASIDIEFCLCWANENWTRRWDGGDSTVLMGQAHSREDDARVFEDMARYLADPRCMRIDGKPIVLVYRPAIMPDARAMTDAWRGAAIKRGWPGLFLIATNAFQFEDAGALGFDALCEFPPHGVKLRRREKTLTWLNPQHSGAVFAYPDIVASEEGKPGSLGTGVVFPGVMPGWDNEARMPGAGSIYHGSSPAHYRAWLAAAIARARRTLSPDRQLVFINAWNEWAEGAYLEPDRRFGRAYLSATAEAVCLAARS